MLTTAFTALLALAGIAIALLARNRVLRDRLESRARYFALRDPLTGLPARAMLHDQITQVLANAMRAGRMAAVLFVDLDRFKAVNDTFGHVAGDEVLREAARRLTRHFRGEQVVGRISSDEFVVGLSGLERAEDAALAARDILAELHRPFDLGGKSVYCTASIGIALHPGDGTTAGTLMRNADIAMYRAKERGRNAFEFFLPEMHQRAVRRLHLETALRGALDRGELLLHYQPKVALATDEVTGFEALLRWRHPELGLVSPAEFIPILEDTDLIAPVGEWVLREACRQVARWAADGFEPRPVAVNLSARQFRMANFDRVVARTLRQTGIDPALLELELTESLLMQDPEETVRMLATLKRYGVRLAVDDFGTGYSSLAYLRRFPIDALKIDRAFVAEAAANADDGKIAAAIIDLGHSLGLRVVAEGVETPEQLEFLRARGCDEVQGFLISAPLAAREARERLSPAAPESDAVRELSARRTRSSR
jgi:diguanylate cyclase (GGDEF)-like protein